VSLRGTVDIISFNIPHFLKPIRGKKIPTQIRTVFESGNEKQINVDLEYLIDTLKARIKDAIVKADIRHPMAIYNYPVVLWLEAFIVDTKLWNNNTLNYQTFVRDLSNASVWYEKLIPDILQGDKLKDEIRFKPCSGKYAVLMEDDMYHISIICKAVRPIKDPKLSRLEVKLIPQGQFSEFITNKYKLKSLF